MPFQKNNQSCPICESSNKQQFLFDYARIRTSGFSLYQCPDCYVQYWTPMASPTDDWYSENYSIAYGLRLIFALKLLRPVHRKFIKWMAVQNHSRILDIGCGTGEVVAALRKQGHEAYGVDFGKKAISSAKKHFGDFYFCQSLDDFFKKAPISNLDVITFFEVIEHLEKPQVLVENAKSLLNIGGRIVLSTPSRDRWCPNLNEWDFPPHHLTRWDIVALDKLFLRFGFVRESNSSMDSLNFILSGIVSLFRRISRSDHITADAVSLSLSKYRVSNNTIPKITWLSAKMIKWIIFGVPALLIWIATRPFSSGGVVSITYKLDS
jgi:SAM-dependent methyltransferase